MYDLIFIICVIFRFPIFIYPHKLPSSTSPTLFTLLHFHLSTFYFFTSLPFCSFPFPSCTFPSICAINFFTISK